MSIESKIPTEELSIRDLSLEQPVSPELEPFDATKELNEFNFRWIRDEFRDMHSNVNDTNIARFFNCALALKYLQPELFNSVSFGADDFKKIEETIDATADDSYIDYEAKMALLSPEKARRWPAGLRDTIKGLEKLLISNTVARANFLYSREKILFHRQFVPPVLTDEEHKAAQKFIMINETLVSSEDIFMNQAVNYRLLYPERFKELPISAQFWKRLKKHAMDTLNTPQPSLFAQRVFNLHLLSAEKVEITENGLEIVAGHAPGKNLPAAPIPLPQTKKF